MPRGGFVLCNAFVAVLMFHAKSDGCVVGPPAASRVKQVASLKLLFNRSERLAEIAGVGLTPRTWPARRFAG